MPSDEYFDMESGLPHGEDDMLMHAMVKRVKLNDDGTPIGTESTNSLVDTRSYEIEFYLWHH